MSRELGKSIFSDPSRRFGPGRTPCLVPSPLPSSWRLPIPLLSSASSLRQNQPCSRVQDSAGHTWVLPTLYCHRMVGQCEKATWSSATSLYSSVIHTQTKDCTSRLCLDTVILYRQPGLKRQMDPVTGPFLGFTSCIILNQSYISSLGLNFFTCRMGTPTEYNSSCSCKNQDDT